VRDVFAPVGLRFGLDGEYQADIAWGDRDVTDVAPAMPAQRVTHPPPIDPQQLKGVAHLPFGACAHAATASQPDPMARVRGESHCRDHKDARHGHPTLGGRREREYARHDRPQDRRDRPQDRRDRAAQTSPLL
jgi:hypothetical protein